MPRRVRLRELSLDYYDRSRCTRTRLVLWRFQWFTQFRLFTLICRRLETRINHSISRITGLFGTRRGFWQCWRHCSVVTLSLLSLAFLWLYYFCPDSAGSTAGLSLYDYFSWPFCGSAASGDSLSLAPARPPGCSRGRLANDSRGRGGHVRRISR